MSKNEIQIQIFVKEMLFLPIFSKGKRRSAGFPPENRRTGKRPEPNDAGSTSCWSPPAGETTTTTTTTAAAAGGTTEDEGDEGEDSAGPRGGEGVLQQREGQTLRIHHHRIRVSRIRIK